MFWFKRKNDSKPNIKIPMVGEYITFGNYWQGTDSVKTPIEWLVLEVNKNKALLVSRYGLDCRQYHHVWTTWEYCDLRKWLNNDFLKVAFSEEEQQKIKLSDVLNDDNPEYGTYGGNNTRDHVFCLSIAESERYFKTDYERRFRLTEYACKQGESGVICARDRDGRCWWLRSPGCHQDYVSFVNSGGVDLVGSLFNCDIAAVRPALWLSCDTLQLSSNFCFKCGCDLMSLNQSSGADYSAVNAGDYVMFGSYPQNNGTNKEPIEWRVLEVSGNEAFLVSRYGLDCRQYHHQVSVTWENCDLRKWLNGEFLRDAFTEAEQKKIAVTKLVNDNNATYGTFGGNSTEDRVFCMSHANVKSFFKDNAVRRCVPTPYAVGKGAWQNKLIDGRGCCHWWLRSPGGESDYALRVSYDATIFPYGDYVSLGHGTVRPALWLKL